MNRVIIDAMYSLGKSDAKDLRMRAHSMDGTAIIAEDSKIPDFVNKDYSTWPAGAPVQDDGQVYTLIQPYDATVHTDRPAKLPALWSVRHTKDPERAKAWAEPNGTSGMYLKDECYLHHDGRARRCLAEQTVYDADAMPDYWEVA